MRTPKAHPIRSTIASAVLLATLTACGGNSSEGDPSSTSSGLSITSITVAGSVGDGPITGADLSFYDANGALVATTRSDGMANYTAHLGADTLFPVTVVARSGIDVVTGTAPTFDMVSVIESAAHSIANVNPFSTLIVRMAAKMPGGITSANLQLAKDMLADNFSFGLDHSLIADPVTSEITASNAATVVKSSEVVAELIRRVHATLSPLGQSISENAAIDALSSDLTDGFLDGEGANGAQPLTAAVAKIIEAQVLYEALTNDLMVNDGWATGAMDNALKLILPGTTLTTSDADITDAMLTQTDTALAAVSAVIPSADIDAVRNVISSAREGGAIENLIVSVKPVKVQETGSYELATEFDTALTTVTTDTTTVTTVNNTELGNKRNAPPKIAFYSEASTVQAAGTTVLQWSASNSVTCSATGGWSGVKPVSGSETTAPLAATTNFSLKCFGNNGKSATQTITVNVAGSTVVVDNTATLDIVTTDPVTTAPTDTDPTVTEPTTAEPTTSEPTPAPAPAPAPVEETTPEPETLVIRVNAGGGDYVDTAGNLWRADYGFNTGTANAITDAIAGTSDDVLYQSERWDAAGGDELEYAFTVPSGRYVVNLHFVDRFTSAGTRVFDVQFEGRTLLDNLDIFAQAGRLTALVKSVAVDVTDGQLNIRFLHGVENPKIDAIEIIQVDASVPTTEPPMPSVAPMTLTWQPNPVSDNIIGYLIYYGGDENSVSIPAGDVRIDSAGFSPAAPSLTYHPETDFGLQAGNRVCFKIRAYNADGLSNWSAPVCGMIAQAI